VHGSDRFDVLDTAHFSPRWYTPHVTASTSSALGSRPSAFQRMLHDPVVLAAEILAFIGRSATMSS
jgi:hypothetical protein